MTAQRHHLIYLDPHADFSIISCHENKKVIEEKVLAWFAKGLPCIYAKQSPVYKFSGQISLQDTGYDEKKETINLGLPLLYAHKKHRVAICAAQFAVQKQKSLPHLMEMQDFFLACYGINELSKVIELYQVFDIAVYGSFLFHYLSGQNYVTETSDLDLLINYDGYSLIDLDELICGLTKKFNRAIDGEVRFHQLGDVAIKELLNLSAKKILCKTRDEVKLLSRAELYEHYPML